MASDGETGGDHVVGVDRLDDDARRRLRSAFLDAVTPLQAGDGTIATGWGLRLVRARAA